MFIVSRIFRGLNLKELYYIYIYIYITFPSFVLGKFFKLLSYMFIVGKDWTQITNSRGRWDILTRKTRTEREKENPTCMKTKFYFCIKMFLCVSVILLGFEIVSYLKSWHFRAPKLLQFQLQILCATHP